LNVELLLEVDQLGVSYRTGRGVLHAVDRVSLAVHAGETVALVGESGCGKSSLGKAVMQLIKPAAGAIRLEGANLTTMSARQLRPYRRKLQMVFQDSSSALDPRYRVARLVGEPLEVFDGLRGAGLRERVQQLLAQVGLAEEHCERLPHELSGGQRQRVAIARALAAQPRLIVCDEPVSALDVSLQAQILNLLSDLRRQRGLAYLFISHDLSVVQHLADRILVMYLGQIVENAPRASFWRRPLHPYTQALIAAVPLADPTRARNASLALVAGEMPSSHHPPRGCRFHTRCPQVMAACRHTAPALREVGPGHFLACHLDVATPVAPTWTESGRRVIPIQEYIDAPTHA
jgi:peptide/nickel transport system ATP-binding protein